MIFFIGLHMPSHSRHFDNCFISVNRLWRRKSDFLVTDWVMDSGAFSQISKHGRYIHSEEEYAQQIKRWSKCGNLLAAVSQDYMCEPEMLLRTGKTVREHQQLTIERYDKIAAKVPQSDCYVMPVLQGYDQYDYVSHVKQYGDRLKEGQWVGVGSVCKRNRDPMEIEKILSGIKDVRRDLRLHGFGVKITSLRSREVRDNLHSADSMAWSFAARKSGRDANDWREARLYVNKVDAILKTDLGPRLTQRLLW